MGAGRAAGPCQGGEGEGVDVAQAGEVLISHSLGMLRCLPELPSPRPSCSARMHRGCSERHGRATISVGLLPRGHTSSCALGCAVPTETCKNTAACTALPPSPETSRVPGASSSPRLIIRGGRGGSAQRRQPLQGLWVRLSPR